MVNGEAIETVSRRIAIRGLPIFSGELLTAASPEFHSLRTPCDFAAFAKHLRGQFSIVIEEDLRIIAITDFGCSRPVFYVRDSGKIGYRAGSRVSDLVPYSSKRFSREALFFYVTRGGVGIFPFYSDILEVFPATVACFEEGRMETLPYLDWGEFLEIRPIEPAAAEARFIEIASEYLDAIARGRGGIACLLSGGTDSALIAWLLRSIGQEGVCLTGDYDWKRYSEFAEAAATAKALGVPHRRVLVNRAGRRRAFSALNSEDQNAPCCHSQSPILHELAGYAVGQGIPTLATGDHADALFLGFDRFFKAFPADPEGYALATSGLDASAKLAHLYGKPEPTSVHSDLLSVFRCREEDRFAWEEAMYAADCRDMSSWADGTPLDLLQQLDGQIWAGISWQNSYLPVTQAFDDRVEFVSPFHDIEMIRFAMSLPAQYKFRGGATKALLRDVLGRVLGRSIVKRASPNPSRVWRMAPDFSERRMLPKPLRRIYDRLFLRNLASSGQSWQELDKVAALGIWLSHQPLGIGGGSQ